MDALLHFSGGFNGGITACEKCFQLGVDGALSGLNECRYLVLARVWAVR